MSIEQRYAQLTIDERAARVLSEALDYLAHLEDEAGDPGRATYCRMIRQRFLAFLVAFSEQQS